MKTTDSRDPLDRKIDDLLASRPLMPSDDFAARVIAAADEVPTNKANNSRVVGQLLRFALPIAALIAIALTLAQFQSTKPTEPASRPLAAVDSPIASAIDSPSLTTADMQEIFLLEEGLAGLTQLNGDNLSSTDLLSALDALYLEI